MKTLLRLLFALAFLCPAAMNAQTVSFKVNVNNPDAIKVSVNSVEQTLVAGDNSLSGTVGNIVRIEPKGSYVITEALGADGNPMFFMNGYYQAYVYQDWEGKTLKFTALTEEEAFPNTFTLTVDDASKAYVYMQSTYRDIPIVNGSQTLRFSDTDNVIVVSSVSFAEPLYQVSQNGTPIEGGSPYTITLSDGDRIDVEANAPEVYYKLKFEFVNPGTEAVITRMFIAGETVEDMSAYMTGDGVDVKGESNVQFQLNTNDYKINSVKLNGEPTDFYQFKFREATTVTIDARLWEHPTKKVYIEGAGNIAMYNGYSAVGGIPVEIKEGLNEIVYAEDYSNYCVLPERDCYITEMRMGDTDLLETWGPAQPFFDFAMEGDLHIKAERHIYDKNFIVYVDNKDEGVFDLGLYDGANYPVELTDGYNIVPFYDLINPFEFNAVPFEGTPTLYLDDEILTEGKQNDYLWVITPADGSVYKMFVTSNPDKFNFSITNDEGAEVTVKRDVVVPVTDFSAPLSMLPGTRIDVEAPAGKKVAVSLNGAEPVEVETFSTEVNGEGTLAILKSAGISSFAAELSGNEPVYNLQGIRLTDSSRFDTLPAGIYIVGGRKVVRR